MRRSAASTPRRSRCTSGCCPGWSVRRLRRRSRGCPGESWAPASGRSCVLVSLSRIAAFASPYGDGLAGRRRRRRCRGVVYAVRTASLSATDVFPRGERNRALARPRWSEGSAGHGRHLLDRSRVVRRAEGAQRRHILALPARIARRIRTPPPSGVTQVTSEVGLGGALAPPDSLISGTPNRSAILVRSWPGRAETGARSSTDRASDYGSEGLGFESLRARRDRPRSAASWLLPGLSCVRA